MKDYFVSDKFRVEQTEETKALLNKPLTESDEPKVWPEKGIRGFNCQPVAAFSDNPVNPGLYYSDECFARLKSMGVNSLRVMIRGDQGNIWDLGRDAKELPPIPEDDPMAPYRNHLEGLKVALHLAEKYDMWIIPSGDDVIGRRIDYFYQSGDGGVEGYFNSLRQLWIYIATNFGKHPRLLAYDLLNEPWTDGESKLFLETCVPELIKEIRAIDKNTFLIVEPPPFALPASFEKMPVFDDEKIVYSTHWYFPHMYTHQGLGSYPQPAVYPGVLKNFPDSPDEVWNREKMKEYLKPVRDFQLKNNAIIWIGEFSAIRYAPGAAKWLEDSIAVFEEYGWSWAAHAYRGWNGWNHTFEADERISNIDDGGKTTDRLQALINGFANNK